jgi:hypothetical protein
MHNRGLTAGSCDSRSREHYETEFGRGRTAKFNVLRNNLKAKRVGIFKSLFGNSKAIQHTGILLTSEWLIWATTDGKGGAASIAARLSEIRVKDYASSLIEDCGLEIFGFVNQSPKRVQAFVGLGREPAAEKLKLTLKATADSQGK